MREEKTPGLGRGFGRAWARARLVISFTLVLISSLTSTSWAQAGYKTLHTFKLSGRGGYSPYAGLVADLQGNLYGTTNGGGANNYGTVFELAPNGQGGWKETVLHSFNHSGDDGFFPVGALIFDAAGALYGTANQGGAHNSGTAFELAPDGHGGWAQTVLHSFDGRDGYEPSAGLIFDAAGNLYGRPSAAALTLMVLSSNWHPMATAAGRRLCSTHSTFAAELIPLPA